MYSFTVNNNTEGKGGKLKNSDVHISLTAKEEKFIYIYLYIAPSAFPHQRDIPDPSSYFLPPTLPSPAAPRLSCREEFRTPALQKNSSQ